MRYKIGNILLAAILAAAAISSYLGDSRLAFWLAIVIITVFLLDRR